MTEESEPGVRITNREIYDKLTVVEMKIDPIPKTIDDHESRLRVIEAAMNRNAWLPVLITAVVTALLIGAAARFLIP